MRMPQLVVTAVLVEGRTTSEVARDHGVSRRWDHPRGDEATSVSTRGIRSAATVAQ